MDIFIVLTGRKRSGKDTVADIAINEFGCAGKVALATWFKEELSKEFKIQIEKFSSDAKDMQMSPPFVLSKTNLHGLISRLNAAGYEKTNLLSTSKWVGRQLDSIRELMLWFGHEVVSQNCGDDFHCKVTEKRALKSVPRKENHANIIFVTDARQFLQSKYFVDKYPFVFPVLVRREGASNDTHAVEKSTDEFPDKYFFRTIENNGTPKDLKEKVKALLLSVKGSVYQKMGKPANEYIAEQKAKEEKSSTTIQQDLTKEGENK